MDKPRSTDEYLATFSEERKVLLQQVRETIKNVAPETEETISYGMPAYKLNGKALVYFAAYNNHIGFYAIPTGHSKFDEKLSNYRQGKGSVQFPINEPLPLELITEIVQFRITEVLKKVI
ncbi:DUF1801 domain-containing protein [Flavobacterium sp.]|uniref:iron chaperone n=1 Tax=Flavobacterium sp. TaxID=239 RepID=UPI00262F33C3|nr:DUF1801 domain-containing protein [Flavobacterium sp.]